MIQRYFLIFISNPDRISRETLLFAENYKLAFWMEMPLPYRYKQPVIKCYTA